MKPALALVTHARHSYFEVVLTSLLSQKIDGKPVAKRFDVYIFQDGLALDSSPEIVESHRKTADIAQRLGSDCTFIQQSKNLGIARHFDFIERHLFVGLEYDFVGFFEDDLLLAPGYMKIFDVLRQRFQDDPRVGMISASPSVRNRPVADQRTNLHRYDHMDHNWAFGLSRNFWLRRQPFVDNYLQFVADIPYKDRPTPQILDWLDRCGLQPHASSQDYIKQCATAAIGGVRLSTFPNYGLYIGQTGVHCTPELFAQMGFHSSIICDTVLQEAAELSDSEYERLYKAQLANHAKNPAEFDIDHWNHAVTSGMYTPTVVSKAKNQPSVRDIESAYRLLLGRDAESVEVIQRKLGLSRDDLLQDFLLSEEFVRSSTSKNLIPKVFQRMQSGDASPTGSRQ